MKAFVSYSLNDKDELVMAILSSKLREKGFSINISHDFYSEKPNPLTQLMISEATLFVGVITQNSTQLNRVYQEWSYAQKRKIPSILLVEGNIQIDSSIHLAIQNKYIAFDRQNPKASIERIDLLRKTATEEAVPWLLGGAALVAVIGLLSGNRR